MWQKTDRISFAALLLLIIIVPLPYASQRNWAIALWFLICTVIFAFRLIQVVISDHGYARLNIAKIPISLLLFYSSLIGVQLLSRFEEHTSWSFISHDLHQTRLWLILTLTYAEIFVLVVLSVNTRFRLKLLMWTVIFSGALQAFLAIILMSLKFEGSFFFFHVEHVVAMGSFSGRNIFAAYMELCLAVGVGMLVSSMAKKRLTDGAQEGFNAALNSFFEFLLSTKMLLRGVLVVMVIALVLTRSRMGNAAFFASLFFGGVLVAVAHKELRKVAGILVFSMLLVDLLVVGQWVGLDRVVQRLSETPVYRVVTQQPEETEKLISPQVAIATAILRSPKNHYEESVEDRTEASRQAMQMVFDRPWFGFGAGTFYTSFLHYQPPELDGFWNHPHNDFMEIAVDTGLLGLGLLVVLCVLAAFRAFQAMRGKFDELKFATGLACLLALTCMLIHGSVDFVLQIPANAMLLCIILASVYAGAFKAEEISKP